LFLFLAQDFTVFGGSLPRLTHKRSSKSWIWRPRWALQSFGLMILAARAFTEGVMSLAGYADIFLRNTLYSGVVPQISAIMGRAGGAVYSPAITDFISDGRSDFVHVITDRT